MSLGRLLLLIATLASVATGARQSSSHAFISPARQTCRDVGEYSRLPDDAPRARGAKPKSSRGVKGLKLAAAAKAGAGKKKKSVKKAAKPEVENFKKSEFVASVAEKTGFTKAESEDALTAVLETIAEQMALEKKITLVGFGTFQAKDRAARKGRNPRTGEEIDIPASKAPTFSASKALKNFVNGIE